MTELEHPELARVEVTLKDDGDRPIKELITLPLPYADAEAFQSEIAAAMETTGHPVTQRIAGRIAVGPSTGDPALFNKHGITFRTSKVFGVQLVPQ